MPLLLPAIMRGFALPQLDRAILTEDDVVLRGVMVADLGVGVGEVGVELDVQVVLFRAGAGEDRTRVKNALTLKLKLLE